MQRRLSDSAVRTAALAMVAAAAAAAAIVAAPGDKRGAVVVGSADRPPERTGCCHPASGISKTGMIDGSIAKLAAPSTTVHLVRPLRETPSLGQRGYVFPLLGPYPPFFDTFGVPRADVPWHHGDDLFAAYGSPVLAVASGVVFSVGWNRIGGWRLWLLDKSGNEFYYAHLAGYSTLAVDGRRVKGGNLIGYVGASGDARGTPPHLFFEINPASLRRLGYDGTVDPTRYLHDWRELRRPRSTSE